VVKGSVKDRHISAAPFRDRVVHHAICDSVLPLFEKSFIFDSYANRIGKGTHQAINRYERFNNASRFVLRCDIYRYFPAIDHAILKADIARRVRCVRTNALIDKIIDNSNEQEPVNLYFDGDDLWTPFTRRRGLPIGNLTSQSFANIYLNPLDHFVKEQLRVKRYVRYMDDFALFHENRDELEALRQSLSAFLDKRRLRLHPTKTKTVPCSEPCLFLGMELHQNRLRRLPANNLNQFCREEVERRVYGWMGHASAADSYRLRQTLFAGGWFDPSTEPRKKHHTV
jgi:retron-type reverse transcriptase